MPNPQNSRAWSEKRILNSLRDTVDKEITSLRVLQSELNGAFARAVQLMHRCKGKIIVTGVGKSGNIGRKISGTLVSTGTPSMFLEPSEAMHGGLGVVQQRDIVLAIGKSGESDELNGLLKPLKRIGCKIIALTANSRSTLARQSDLTLYTRIESEACPLNLAPTSSTTVALVAGDALAVTLMKIRGIKPEQFGLYHPGGRLGRRLLWTVHDLMHGGQRNPVIRSDASISQMFMEISRQMLGAVSVVDAKMRLKGLVTDYDVRKVLEKGESIFDKTISEIMNSKPGWIYDDKKASDALAIMESRDRHLSLLPVLNRQHRVVGMIHMHDIISKGL